MKKIYIIVSLMCCIPFYGHNAHASFVVPEKDTSPLAALSDSQPIASAQLQEIHHNLAAPRPKGFTRNSHNMMVSFNYENEDLVDIINELAGLKSVNVIFPQGANAITQKVTFALAEKIGVEEAWKMLHTLLDIAGYTMMPRGNMYEIVKNNPNISREALPLYIGVNAEKLPDTDQRIRYIYYLSNIKVSDAQDSETTAILQNLLPQTTSSFKIDTSTNAVIISAKANDIKAVMRIINSLDKIEFQETLSFIKLHYTTADTVAKIFNENILKTQPSLSPYHLGARQQTELSFFSKHIRIIPEPRTNTLIVLGRPQAIDRVKDFIQKNIDVPLDEGKSILHIYQLQYLDATQVKDVLDKIIDSAKSGGTGQAQIGASSSAGAVRFFDEVKIMADKPSGQDTKYYGSNKLIISARNEDWRVIERLIAELDIPQPQVLLEVLVADLTLDDLKTLGTQLRNPAKIPMPGTSSAQSAQIVEPLGSPLDNPTTLASNLLQNAFTKGANGSCELSPSGGTSSMAGCFAPGTTVLEFNDNNGSAWGVMQILNAINRTKILSHPHVITINNQKAHLEIGQTRLLKDEAVGSGGTTTTIKNKLIQAHLKVDITPRISAANTVLLEVNVDVSDFAATSGDDTRFNRLVDTSAIVKDKSVLSLGGLIRTTESDTLRETPILGKIPILGWFFKRRSKNAIKNNLTVFISPTIIQPRLRSGVSEYTRDYINLAKNSVYQGGLFDSLRDPVTRWYFKVSNDAPEMIDDFLDKDEFKRDLKTSTKPNPRLRQTKKLPPVAEVPTPMERKLAKKPQQALETLIAQDDQNPLLAKQTVTS
jgi:general secretion pathway protein D